VFAQFEKELNLNPGSVVDTIKKTGADGSFARLERGELTVGEFSKPFSDEYLSVVGIEVPPENFKELLEGMRTGQQVTARSVVVEVIAKLQKLGVKTAILTNNFRYDDGRTLFPKDKLEVDVVIESCVEGMRKPECAIYQLALKRLGVEPREAVFLDDIGSNLKTASEMGISTIKVREIAEALEVLEKMMDVGALINGTGSGCVPGTSEVSEKLQFPVEGLVTYLKEKHDLFGNEPPLIRQFKHGQSNPTYYIQYAGAQLVLRKKPPGKLLPSAHAVEREYRVMKATQEAGVPIPGLLSLCEDESVIGTPFYLMRYVPGQVLKNPALPGHHPHQREVIYKEMVRVLASIHAVDIERAGLSDFGRHG
jgi:acyl-CoA dehydrogenase family protein 10